MNTLRPNLVEPAGLEPAMHGGGGFTVHWGYQFSYDSINLVTLSAMLLDAIIMRIESVY